MTQGMMGVYRVLIGMGCYLLVGLQTASASWFWQNPWPTGRMLFATTIVDDNTVIAVGDIGLILRTEDGGVTWTQQVSGTTQYLSGVSFTDANTGTVVGGGGTILHTTDGGATWTQQVSGTTQYLAGVSFTDTNAGTVVGGEGTILHTTDGGATWTQQVSGTTQNLVGISFLKCRHRHRARSRGHDPAYRRRRLNLDCPGQWY
jgi:photosystem II stability/assembly factor-like uncharacterized protein